MKCVNPKILVFCDYYLPGYKSGGGMRTIVNMVERLHPEFDFFIVTRDHDGREDFETYKSVKLNDWNDLDNAKVFYLPKSEIKMSALKKLVNHVKPDAIYLNSFFSTLAIFVLILKRLRKIPNINVILAPCGELTEGSLKLKPIKKKTFRFLADKVGIYSNLIWKASSELEVNEIESVTETAGTIFVAPDLPSSYILPKYVQSLKHKKVSGELRLVFMSRISAKKNLMWFLEILLQITDNVQLDIIGPIEDENYWNKCSAIIFSFQSNIKCNYLGSIPNNVVIEKLIEYDFFVLPTLSENFGHVFLEALSAGCPLITTDRTPWLDLEEKNIGWDLPLENPGLWLNVLKRCAAMDNMEYHQLSENSRRFAVDWLADVEIEEATRKVLNYAVTQQFTSNNLM
jgi:glycosyltransferase involved in cell wall biosynthesis